MPLRQILFRMVKIILSFFLDPIFLCMGPHPVWILFINFHLEILVSSAPAKKYSDTAKLEI